MGSISPAVKGWSMATGSTRSSGWNKRLHIACRNRPGAALLGRKDWDIERVHVGPRTGFPHNRSGAAEVIRVAVSENQVLELIWRTAKPADRPEDGCLLIRVTSIDPCQPVVTLDQKGVCHPHRDDGEHL